MVPNKPHINDKTYRTQAQKTKMHEETNISNTFVLLYFYSSCIWINFPIQWKWCGKSH